MLILLGILAAEACVKHSLRISLQGLHTQIAQTTLLATSDELIRTREQLALAEEHIFRLEALLLDHNISLNGPVMTQKVADIPIPQEGGEINSNVNNTPLKLATGDDLEGSTVVHVPISLTPGSHMSNRRNANKNLL